MCFAYSRQRKLLCVCRRMYFSSLRLVVAFSHDLVALPEEGSFRISFWWLTIRQLEALQFSVALSTSPPWPVPQAMPAGSSPTLKEHRLLSVLAL